MNNAAQIKELLEELVRATGSPVYAVCDKIVSYLEHNPQQRNLTIGGLRAALNHSDQDDNVLIQSAFTLVAHPFQALDVRYKLYDEHIKDVLEELDHSTYMQAVSEQHFIDDDGNDIAIEDLNARIFPYFINLFKLDRPVKIQASIKVS